jgi:hypothetical protein
MDLDSDPDPAIFVFDLQAKNFFKIKFICLMLLEGTFTSFSKDKKVQKKSQTSRNQGFSYYFCFFFALLFCFIFLVGIKGTDTVMLHIWLKWKWIRIRMRHNDEDPTISGSPTLGQAQPIFFPLIPLEAIDN